MKAARASSGAEGYPLLRFALSGGWIPTLGAACAVAIAYFLAARLGLALLLARSDVAVFWPASGLAAGILIMLGPRARPALVIGVIVGTVAAGLLGSRELLTSIFNGTWNAGEAVVAAWLLERWFGQPFMFCDLRRVVGFLVAAGFATAACGVAGAFTLILLHPETIAPIWDVWREWFLSSWVGLVVVAPLVIGLAQTWRQPPPGNEWMEGTAVLGLMVVACSYTMAQKTGSWLSFSPGAFIVPLLLWLTARCQPTFAIAGAFLSSVWIICAVTFGIGRFGDAAVPVMQRVIGAQLAMMTVTLFTLVLAVLFDQRKKAEEALRHSERQLVKERTMLARLHEVGTRLWLKRDLPQALDEILAGAIELLGADMGAIRTLDFAQGKLKIEAHRGFKQEFLDFFREFSAADDSACGRVLRSGQRIVIDDVEADTLYRPLHSIARAAGYRAVQSTPIKNCEGVLLGTLATHFRSVHKPDNHDLRLLDLYVRQAAEIIERHRAEDALRDSEERLRLAQLQTGIGIWDVNLRTGKLAWTPELEVLFGLKPGTVKCYSDFRDRVHPEDIAAIESERAAAVRRREPYRIEYRIIRPDGQIRWIAAIGGALYNEATGKPTRIIGNNADITERKLAELALAERNLQLALAGKIGRVGAYTYDVNTEKLQVSEGYAALHGLPEGTTTETLREWRTRVHPEDLGRVEGVHDQAVTDKRGEYNAEYRIVRPDGEVRWTERRCLILYDGDARPKRVVGVSIDITDHKLAELALAERNAQLLLAGKDASVGHFAHDLDTRLITMSEGYVAIHGLPEGTTQSTMDEWRSRVHPNDLPQFDELRRHAFDNRRPGYTFDYRIIRADGEIRWIDSRRTIYYDGGGQPRRIVGINIDVTERKQLEDHKTTLISELDHRVKNVLASVSAVAARTKETSRSMGEFVAALDGRIKSMAITHELLSSRHWQGIPLAELVRCELAPYATASNTRLDGPDVILSADAGQVLSMVFHELATNAAKFGAISASSGTVSVRWSFRPNGDAQSLLCIQWQESGGPTVERPTHAGYGDSVVRELVPYELGGGVDLDFLPQGVRCRLKIPAHWLSASNQQESLEI